MSAIMREDLYVPKDARTDEVLWRLKSYGVAIIPNYLSAADLDSVRGECLAIDNEQPKGSIERKYHCGRSILVDRREWDAMAYPAIEKAIRHNIMDSVKNCLTR